MTYEQHEEMYVRKDDLRDRFAIAALTGLTGKDERQVRYDMVAEQAYHLADDMLKARNRRVDEPKS